MAFKILNRHNLKLISPQDIIVKILRLRNRKKQTNKQKSRGIEGERYQLMIIGQHFRTTTDFSSETLNPKTHGIIYFKP